MGGVGAKEQIFHIYLSIVPRVVRYYVGNGAAIEDLEREAILLY